MKKQFKKLLGFFVGLVLYIPADLVIFFGLLLQQFKSFLLPFVDKESYVGMWTLWGYDVVAGYYVSLGVVLYFLRYFIRRHRRNKSTKTA